MSKYAPKCSSSARPFDSSSISYPVASASHLHATYVFLATDATASASAIKSYGKLS